jgi:crotonobetainyl-CoA:carnitine CoA-transferase CaiB-like acyl-CoA transferase
MSATRRAHHLTTRSYCQPTRRGHDSSHAGRPRPRGRRAHVRPAASALLYRLAATCDVFLTNKLPCVRAKLRVDLDDIRAHIPQIVYVSGTGQGERGPDADRGSYDSLAYWCRSGIAMGAPPKAPSGNPLSATYATRDGRYVAITCLQAAKYWPEVCGVVDRPDLAADERFRDAEAMKQNAPVAAEALRNAFAQRDAGEWRERLAGFSGQWAMVQDTLEAAADHQTIANGYVQDCETADGLPFQLAAAPVQYGGEPAAPRRAPGFNEHGDAILEASASTGTPSWT